MASTSDRLKVVPLSPFGLHSAKLKGRTICLIFLPTATREDRMLFGQLVYHNSGILIFDPTSPALLKPHNHILVVGAQINRPVLLQSGHQGMNPAAYKALLDWAFSWDKGRMSGPKVAGPDLLRAEWLAVELGEVVPEVENSYQIVTTTDDTEVAACIAFLDHPSRFRHDLIFGEFNARIVANRAATHPRRMALIEGPDIAAESSTSETSLQKTRVKRSANPAPGSDSTGIDGPSETKKSKKIKMPKSIESASMSASTAAYYAQDKVYDYKMRISGISRMSGCKLV